MCTIAGKQNNLRSIIEPQRDNTITYSPADDHCGGILGELARIIFREETLIRSHQSANERQAELASMGMASEHQIHSSIDI